jgi:hypothetical protein
LDEDAWTGAAVIDLPYEYFPGDNVAPPVRTECLVTYDAAHVYIAFRAFDPRPAEIRAHLADRDAITTFQQDDHVGFQLDPFNDERRAFQFRVNPLGVQAEAIFSELDGIEDFSWDAIWETAGRITDEGYVVEVAVPFNQLRFPAASGPQTWGFDAFRSYPRNFRYRIAASTIDRNRSCLLCQVNKVVGFDGITPGRNLEVAPTITGRRTDRRPAFPGGALEKADQEADLGVNVRWGMTPNLTLNATANPDFSQIEADVAQLEVNNRFALFFPEKRPFFLEGIDFFATPLETASSRDVTGPLGGAGAVFTRSVADPLAGLKLTGKTGPHALGVFVARDDVNNLIVPSNQSSVLTSIDQDVTSAVLRYRRDVGAGSTVGLLLTDREADGYHNRLASADAFIRVSAADTLRLQYLATHTQYPSAVVEDGGAGPGAFRGFGLMANYGHFSQRWSWFAEYQDLDPGFRADNGFVPRVDVRQLRGRLTRILRGDTGRWYSRIDLGVLGSRIEDHDGTLTDSQVGVNAVYNGPRQSLLDATLTKNRELFGGVTYDLDRVEVFGEVRPTGNMRLNLFGQVGDAIDFENSRPAQGAFFGPSVEYRFGRSLELRLSHDFERLTVEGGRRLYTARLTQGRLVYHFGTRAFARAILQHRDTDFVPSLYREPTPPESRRLFTQLLFSYKVNPQTVLLVGYSDNALGDRDVGLTRTDRTFFIKVGYAWVL